MTAERTDDPNEHGDEADPDLEGLTFEEALERLQAIVDRLEGGELGLEEAMEAFEEGRRLAEVCRARLDEAEGKLEELLDDGTTAPFEPEAGGDEDDGDEG